MRYVTKICPIVGLSLCLGWTTSALADWTLENDSSRLSFVSVKKGDIAEAHYFQRLDGTISDAGAMTVTIPLASVETGIPIRNERMQNMLFQTDLFPKATVTAKLSPEELEDLSPGDSMMLLAPLTLALHDNSQALQAEVLVTRVSANRVLASSLKPLIVNAGKFGLADGVEQLREIAGLPSISKAVPVSFVLAFSR